MLCDSELESEKKKKKKRRQEFYSQFWNGHSWCVSNFANHHLRNIHPIQNYTNKRTQKFDCHEEKTEMNSSQSTPPVNNLESTGMLLFRKLINVELTDSRSISDKDNENTSLIAVHTEPSNIDANDEFNAKLSNLRAQLRFHGIQVTNTFRNKEEKSECEIELTAGIVSKIEICQIPSDGDCLFGATVHQRFHAKVGSDEYTHHIIKLRKDVMAYIEANLEHYERELLDRIYEQRRKNGDKSKIQNIQEECKKFLQNYLARERHWGGSESIKAISELFDTNVIIFNEWGEVYFGSPFNSSYKDIITLAFRVSDLESNRENLKKNKSVSNIQRNHFDSIIKLSDDVLNKCISNLMANYEKTSTVKSISDVVDIEDDE